jgi:hypothetical protein
VLTPTAGHDEPYAGVEHSSATGWVAWVLLGGVLLLLLGAAQCGLGLIGLFRPEVLGEGRAAQLLPILSSTALAWLHLVLGVAAVGTGLGLLRGLRLARAVAIQLACLTIVINFAFVEVYPAWSVISISLACVICYAAAVHGGEVAGAYGRDFVPEAEAGPPDRPS